MKAISYSEPWLTFNEILGVMFQKIETLHNEREAGSCPFPPNVSAKIRDALHVLPWFLYWHSCYQNKIHF
jgi:hypothetical protein